MKLHQLSFTKGARKKPTRRGIGDSSAGRGEKGYSKREGNAQKFGFEGGQTPLYRRIPKVGFNNPLKEMFDIVNVKSLANFKGHEATPKSLQDAKIYKAKYKKLKVLGMGEISHAVNVHAHWFSKSAKVAIEKAGGKAIVIPVVAGKTHKKAPTKRAANHEQVHGRWVRKSEKSSK